MRPVLSLLEFSWLSLNACAVLDVRDKPSAPDGSAMTRPWLYIFCLTTMPYDTSNSLLVGSLRFDWSTLGLLLWQNQIVLDAGSMKRFFSERQLCVNLTVILKALAVHRHTTSSWMFY